MSYLCRRETCIRTLGSRHLFAERSGIAAIDSKRMMRPKWKRATIKAVFHFDTTRRRDGDNLNAWLKAYADGIADAGVVENDSGLIWLPPEIVVAGKPGVVLEITPQSE